MCIRDSARGEQIALAVEDAAVDLPDDGLIKLHVGAGCKLVNEFEGRTRTEDLEGVLAGQSPAPNAVEEAVDLQVRQRVALDARGAVHGANPGPLSQPVPMHRVQWEVGEQPAPALHLSLIHI